ncbi:MAG: cellulase family glycosylhydrolase [Bacilli bacterium]|nr:cellulase family glycosylhydrolase [Bacilli bacterium]MBN2877866.1 cellulase family glycosylhydrolase [Bacilli bacterium]
MNKIRGVNLGGWLVLEQWMTPELYHGYDAKDEFHLLEQLGESRFDVLKRHRDNFITEADFDWLHTHGINVIRLPIGHWLFEDNEPYVNALEYVENAFHWGSQHDIKILLDVHAAPGCQNGFDNGGLSGIVEWPIGDNVNQTLRFIERLCITFQNEPALFGIEVLNEPRWDIDRNLLQNFYLDSYRIIRKYLNDSQVIVFHDAFRLDEWQEFFESNSFVNVILDTHMYQVFSHNDSTRNPSETIEKAAVLRYHEIKKISYVDLIVGEWSVGLHPHLLKQTHDDYEKEVLYRAVGNSLLTTFEQTRGWFFWNYKLSKESMNTHFGWSYRELVETGIIPKINKGEKQ